MTTAIPVTQDARAIAAGLTAAQRRWIVNAEPVHSWRGALGTFPPSATCKVLHRLGLWFWCGMLTELGLAVRDILKETAK